MQGNHNQHFAIHTGDRHDENPFVLALLLAVCLGLAILAWLMIDLNPPFDLATKSRAMYVDEGFYADAAQNFVKFGQWGLPYDSSHWPGAPGLVVIQTIIFSMFGVSLTAARMVSICFGLISCLSLFAIARTRLSSPVSALLSISAILTIGFMAHSRSAIADPVAVGFSMLALAIYVRMKCRLLAIPLTVILAYMAFCSKMYYLFSLATIIGLWGMELLVLPLCMRRIISARALLLLVASVAIVVCSYVALRLVFDVQFADFLAINSNKTPPSDLWTLYHQLQFSLSLLHAITELQIVILVLVASAGYFLITRLLAPRRLKQDVFRFGRAEWAMLLFLALGLCTVSALNMTQKAHYYYFSILPISYLTVAWLSMMMPGKRGTAVIVMLLIAHLAWHSQFYYQWLKRDNNTSIALASQEIVDIIHAHHGGQRQIPVLGEYSAQLSLYSDRMLSLDARWTTQAGLCQRLAYWRPEFHVAIIWPGTAKTQFKQWLLACDEVKKIQDVGHFPVFDPWEDEILLTRIYYNG